MMRRRVWRVSLLLPVIASGQGVAGGDARPISLDEAVRLAQQNSPTTVQARGQVRTGEASVRSAYGAFIPSLALSSFGGKTYGSQFQTTSGTVEKSAKELWSFSRTISANVDLFAGMKRLSQLRSNRATVSSAESNERLQRFRVALDVKQQYYNVLAARESRTAAIAQLAQAEQQFKASTARVQAGAATVSDSLRSVIQVGNGRLAQLTAENSLRVANANLTRLVGTPFVVTASSSENEQIPSVRLDSAQFASWVEEAPNVLQARSDLNAAQANIGVSRASYLPTLSMSYSLAGNNTAEAFDFGSGAQKSQKNLRFSLSYPLFNQFQREESVTRSSVNETNAIATLRDARLLAQSQLTQYAGSLGLAQERVAIQLASVAAAEEDLRVQSQRYALGGSTLLDVLTSQTTLNQARSSLIQARLDARVAKAQIESLLGRDLP